MNMDRNQINAISNLGLAHIGDGVFELLCRSYLCAKGGKNVGNLHRDTVALVKAPAQAKFAEKLLPHLTGKRSLDEAIADLKLATRRYAKRQMTWFRARPYVRWITADDGKTARKYEEIVNMALELCEAPDNML